MDILSTSKIKKLRKEEEDENKEKYLKISLRLLWKAAKRNRILRKEVKLKKKRMLLEKEIDELR